jgi:hypothetical protein
MVTISTDSFPKKCFQDMAQCFLQTPELPDYMKISGPFFRDLNGKDIQVITIYEFDDAKKLDAMEFIQKREANFDCVKGFKCQATNSWLEPRDALESMLPR